MTENNSMTNEELIKKQKCLKNEHKEKNRRQLKR